MLCFYKVSNMYGKDKAKYYLLENPDVASEIRSQLSVAIEIDNEINQNDLF